MLCRPAHLRKRDTRSVSCSQHSAVFALGWDAAASVCGSWKDRAATAIPGSVLFGAMNCRLRSSSHRREGSGRPLSPPASASQANSASTNIVSGALFSHPSPQWPPPGHQALVSQGEGGSSTLTGIEAQLILSDSLILSQRN